ncbi:uncharacterized protein SPSK_09085 [Sporothrix schenckii 1099-18]|uniref:D-serine dehydratase-like domain-containing protein n=1 Tax=Sporothrix schenckii 1099-18 TaxID=1397361 RepID=A0A0F2M9X0_SPOSC|nr:uncharacterized protein SPSK_09085 [Sporothrix schenckii 1099-18]KJR85899.1 hypothetical protein SPSK_09085 [Sporothrix schenckii 1099-18]
MNPRSFIGKRLGDHDIPTPTAVLDRAVVERNCTSMLAAVQNMNLGWRAHIKTHKGRATGHVTVELTRLQVGDKLPVRLIVSTVLEAERILPLLKAYQTQTTPAPRSVNVLYGVPLYAAAVPRLAAVARELGPGGVSVLIDHPDQIAVAQQLVKAAGTSVRAFVKVDMGSHRAGVVLGSSQFTATIQRVLGAHTTLAGEGLSFYGLYCHAGHSYDAREPWASLAHLVAEFTALGEAAQAVRAMAQDDTPVAAAAAGAQPWPLVLSVGASPTAASLRHPDLGGGDASRTADAGGRAGAAAKENAATLRAKLDDLASQGYELEVHAGVQPVLDLQQLATHSYGGGGGRAETDDLALTVVADVVSAYPGRGAQGGDEFLVNAGCLALGREPVKNVPLVSGAGDGPVYTGWGIVQPWTSDSVASAGAGSRVVPPGADFPRLLPADGDLGWWQVGRISQEHGILTWAGGPPPSAASLQPQLGQRLRIWPNHACIAGAGFSYYLIVDSTSENPDQVVDVWERWTGW